MLLLPRGEMSGIKASGDELDEHRVRAASGGPASRSSQHPDRHRQGVRTGERWALLGPNGAGKTSLVQVLSSYIMASAGEVSILGHRVGHVDVRELRARLGYVSPYLNKMIETELTAAQLVDAAQVGVIVPWYAPPSSIDHDQTRIARDDAPSQPGRTRQLCDGKFGHAGDHRLDRTSGIEFHRHRRPTMSTASALRPARVRQ